jgi:hypothetical protein
VSPMVRSEPPFIGRRGRARGWPGRARDMAVTRSSVISSGRDGQGGVGCVCKCTGEAGGMLASPGDEGEREEQWPEVGGGPGCFSSFLPSLKAGVRAGETESRQRGEWGCPRVLLSWLGRTAEASSTVSLVFRISAQNVFDTMPA